MCSGNILCGDNMGWWICFGRFCGIELEPTILLKKYLNTRKCSRGSYHQTMITLKRSGSEQKNTMFVYPKGAWIQNWAMPCFKSFLHEIFQPLQTLSSICKLMRPENAEHTVVISRVFWLMPTCFETTPLTSQSAPHVRIGLAVAVVQCAQSTHSPGASQMALETHIEMGWSMYRENKYVLMCIYT